MNDPQGIFTMTVPTGGGKTLASLAFALGHAVVNGLDRVIVVIPFTSVVEQTAEVFREAFGDLAHVVLEHHGAFDDTKLRREGGGLDIRDRLRLSQENWDAPIVVTTAVQFFESLFHNKTSRCRKLHNIARSVVILDEAQTLPLPVLRPAVLALDELARNYRTTLVLSTATQPALIETDDPAKSFVDGLRNTRELMPDPPRLFQILKRVEVECVGVQDDVGDGATHRAGGSSADDRQHPPPRARTVSAHSRRGGSASSFDDDVRGASCSKRWRRSARI